MNHKPRVAQIILSGFALLVSFLLVAADSDRPQTSSRRGFLKVTSALDLPVKNLKNERLGQVDDIVFDLRSGEIKYVLLATGTFWQRQRTEEVAIPSAALRLNHDENSLLMDSDKQLLLSKRETSPKPGELIQEAAGANGDTKESEKGDATGSGNQMIAHARQLLGGTLTRRNGEKAGKIKDAAIDFRSNRLVYVVVATGGFLGLGETLSAVRCQGITVVSANEFRVEDEGAILKTASLDKNHWPENFQASFATASESHGEKINEPSGKASPRSTRLTSEDQSNSTQDVELTRSIRKEIMKEGHFSLSAQNITIVTRGSTVTLVGDVKNQSEKEALLAIAKRIGAKAVDDRLSIQH